MSVVQLERDLRRDHEPALRAWDRAVDDWTIRMESSRREASKTDRSWSAAMRDHERLVQQVQREGPRVHRNSIEPITLQKCRGSYVIRCDQVSKEWPSMALFTLDVGRGVAPTISAGNLDLGYFEGTVLIALSEDTLEDYIKDQSESESDTEENDDESDRSSDRYSSDDSRSDSDGGSRTYSNSDRDRDSDRESRTYSDGDLHRESDSDGRRSSDSHRGGDSDSQNDNYRDRRRHSDSDNESNSHSEQYSECDIEDYDSDSDRDKDSDDHSDDHDEEETQSYRGLGSKRKQFPTKAEPPHIKRQCDRPIKTARAPARRVFIRLRGRETGEGEIQPDPVSGYLDFSNEDFTKFVGMIDLPYLSGSVKLEGFKVSTTAKRQYESWSSFSEAAYERARVARWR